MIKPHFTTSDLKARYHLIFAERWANKPIYHGYDAAITADNLHTAQNIALDVKGYIVSIKSVGYAAIKTRINESNVTLDTADFTGTTDKEFSISSFGAAEREAFDTMKSHIMNGVEGIKDVAKDVPGMIERTGDSKTDFLDKIDDTSLLFDIPHRHLTLHLIMLDNAMQGSDKFKESAWDHFALYVRSLNNALNSFAKSIEKTNPNKGDDKSMAVSKLKRK